MSKSSAPGSRKVPKKQKLTPEQRAARDAKKRERRAKKRRERRVRAKQANQRANPKVKPAAVKAPEAESLARPRTEKRIESSSMHAAPSARPRSAQPSRSVSKPGKMDGKRVAIGILLAVAAMAAAWLLFRGSAT